MAVAIAIPISMAYLLNPAFRITNHLKLVNTTYRSSSGIAQRFHAIINCYWTRNYVAWPRFSASQPNETHRTIANWEKSERFTWLITQNVHGSLYNRQMIQEWIQKANPNWCIEEIDELAPDGDYDIPDKAVKNFNLPFCQKCGPKSILKTDVIFFGGFIDPEIHQKCYDMIKNCDGLSVLGFSLNVRSGYRYVEQAYKQSAQILIFNIGPTDADHVATLKISAKCSDIIRNVPNL